MPVTINENLVGTSLPQVSARCGSLPCIVNRKGTTVPFIQFVGHTSQPFRNRKCHACRRSHRVPDETAEKNFLPQIHGLDPEFPPYLMKNLGLGCHTRHHPNWRNHEFGRLVTRHESRYQLKASANVGYDMYDIHWQSLIQDFFQVDVKTKTHEWLGQDRKEVDILADSIALVSRQSCWWIFKLSRW